MTAPLATARQTWQSETQYGGAVSPKGLRASLFLVVRDEHAADGQVRLATETDREHVSRLRSDLLRLYASQEPVYHRPQVPLLVAVLSHGSTLAAAKTCSVAERTARQWVEDFLADSAGALLAESNAKLATALHAVDAAIERQNRDAMKAEAAVLDAYVAMCWQICGRSGSNGGGDLEGHGAGCGHCPRRWVVKE